MSAKYEGMKIDFDARTTVFTCAECLVEKLIRHDAGYIAAKAGWLDAWWWGKNETVVNVAFCPKCTGALLAKRF